MTSNQSKLEVRKLAIQNSVQIEKISEELKSLRTTVLDQIDKLQSIASDLDTFNREIRHSSQKILMDITTSIRNISHIQSEMNAHNEDIISSTYKKSE